MNGYVVAIVAMWTVWVAVALLIFGEPLLLWALPLAPFQVAQCWDVES